MAKRQFRAESKKVLDMMVNSIYTHKEVFLREIISNASDALDKLYFKAITNGESGISRDDLQIWIIPNKDERTITITDNGIGMTKDELIEDLGTIAKSGTLEFRQNNEDAESIGQFGVGFYSAFMVADEITVLSRAYGSEEAWRFHSTGEDGYTVDPCEKDSRGTEIILHVKEDADEENYSKFLDIYTLRSLVNKYSDYIRFPIKMDVEKSRKKDDSEEYETYIETDILNSMVPIWRKKKDEVSDEDYNNFYRDKFFDYAAPSRVISARVEGSVTYTALLFIPSKVPFDYYTKMYKKGLQLYCNGVMIMENCAELLPDHFGFVRGIVDSSDFSLNISREVLQHDRQLKMVAKNIDKKLRSELAKMLTEEREKYEKFFKEFGVQLKYGVYENYGMHKEDLKDLILYKTTADDKYITLKEYVDAMPAEQKYIYYACGKDETAVRAMPQAETVRDKGFSILCMTDDVDEFAVRMLDEYDGKKFKSVTDGDLGLESEEEKEELKRKSEDSKPILDQLGKALEGKVKEVRLSSRLKTHPACLVSEGELTMEMEKILNAMPTEQKVHAQRILEINAEHKVFDAIERAKGDEQKLSLYAKLLYDQAVLLAGLPVEDPSEFSDAVCELIAGK